MAANRNTSVTFGYVCHLQITVSLVVVFMCRLGQELNIEAAGVIMICGTHFVSL